MFRVGQKVVFIGGRDGWRHRWEKFWHPYASPQIGAIYTIANMYTSSQGFLNLELVEFPSPATKHWAAGFRAERFRPVVERKTDISTFTKMLTRKRSSKREDA